MGGRRNAHVWQQDEIDRLRGVPLPAKLKCGRCSKNLNTNLFSTKQLTDARYQVSTKGRIDKAVNCQKCTGQQVVEVECTMCGKTKGLEEFAKSQRNKPDTAKCFKCVEDQLNDEAIHEDKYDDPDNAFITPDHSAGNYPEYFSSATSTTDASSTYGDDDWNSVNDSRRNQRSDNEGGGIALSSHFQQALSISGSTNTLIENEYEHPPASNGNGWGGPRTGSWHTRSVGAASGRSGFDTHSYGNPSAPSISGSARSFGSSVAERSASSEVRSNGWARIRAAPRNPAPTLGGPVRPTGDNVREREPLVNAWGPEDEEDEDEDDNDDDSDDETII